MLYQALPHARCIRVLRVVENSPEQNCKLTILMSVLDLSQTEKDVSFDISKTDSDDEKDFDALSYTWGSPFSTPELKARYGPDSDVQVMILAGAQRSEVKIGRNLYEALQQLWNSGRRRYIWVDALCINQADTLEKSTHVRYMSDIYTKAKLVVVWFGIDDPDLPTFEHIEWLVNRNYELLQKELETQSALRFNLKFEEGNPETLGLEVDGFEENAILFPTVHLRSLHRFFARRRYLSRAWIVQEIALSNNCIAMLGKSHIEMEKLMSLDNRVESLRDKMRVFTQFEPEQETSGLGIELGTIRNYAIYTESLKDGPDNVDADNGIIKFVVESRKQYLQEYYGVSDELTMYYATIESFLESGHARHCTDPKDAIYSLFGYMDVIVPLKEPPIPVDYAMSTTDLYTSLTTKLLEVLPHHTVLSSVCDRQLEKATNITQRYASTLPSWVPDYNRCREVADTIVNTAIVAMGTGRIGIDEILGPNIPCFSAGLDNTTHPPPLINQNELQIYGRRCSQIKSVCRPEVKAIINKSLAQTADEGPAIFVLAAKMCLDHVDDRVKGRDLVEALLRVICVPSPLLGCKLDEEFDEMLKRMIMMLITDAIFLADGTEETQEEAKLKYHIKQFMELLTELNGHPFVPDPHEMELLKQLQDDDQEISDDDMEKLEGYFVNHTNIQLQESTSIFITADNLVGRIPNKVQAGDELCLICNAKVPFVLRPIADGKYALLGEALVDGAMYGELIKNGTAGRPELITIA